MSPPVALRRRVGDRPERVASLRTEGGRASVDPSGIEARHDLHHAEESRRPPLRRPSSQTYAKAAPCSGGLHRRHRRKGRPLAEAAFAAWFARTAGGVVRLDLMDAMSASRRSPSRAACGDLSPPPIGPVVLP